MPLQPSEAESPLEAVDRALCRFQFWRNVLVGGIVTCLPGALVLAILFDFDLALSRPWLLILQLLPGFLLGAGLTALIQWVLDRMADRVGMALSPGPGSRRNNFP